MLGAERLHDAARAVRLGAARVSLFGSDEVGARRAHEAKTEDEDQRTQGANGNECHTQYVAALLSNGDAA